MLLHCPTCQATVEAGPLPPGATATCPYCRGLFQVPAQVVATAIPLAIPMPASPLFSGIPAPPEPLAQFDPAATIYQPPQPDFSQEPLLPPGANPLLPEPPAPVPPVSDASFSEPPAPEPFASELPPVADVWPGPEAASEPTTVFQQPPPSFTPTVPLPSFAPADPLPSAAPAVPLPSVVAVDPILPQSDFPVVEIRPNTTLPASSNVAARSTSPARPRKQGKGLGTVLVYGLAVMGAFALIGGGAGALAVYFMRSPGEVAAAPAPKAPETPAQPWQPEAKPSPAPSTPPAEPKQPGVAVWQIVGNWRGVGSFKTKPFKTTGPRLRIQWNAMPRDPANPDNFALYLTDVRGKRLHTPVSIVGSGADTTLVTAAPRTYVLEVFTFGTDWEVKLDESE